MPSTASAGFSVNSHFSHIYAEDAALAYPAAQRILNRFPNAGRISIRHYKNVFNRPHQDFQLQKTSKKLILAVRKGQWLYEGSDFSQSMGHAHFYYNSPILNCIYNCEYCYLQGMYPSAYIVVFVNTDDFFSAVEEKLKAHPVYLAVSYDPDLLAFENIVPLCAAWIEFARSRRDLTVEIRTKSANYKAIANLAPAGNVILAWTLTPQEIASGHEDGTPSFMRRLEAARQAVADGWNVRLCFDPILLTEHWRDRYAACIHETFGRIPAAKIYDVSSGVFRMNAGYLQKLRKQRSHSAMLHHSFEVRNGSATYADPDKQAAQEFVSRILAEYVPAEKIFL